VYQFLILYLETINDVEDEDTKDIEKALEDTRLD